MILQVTLPEGLFLICFLIISAIFLLQYFRNLRILNMIEKLTILLLSLAVFVLNSGTGKGEDASYSSRLHYLLGNQYSDEGNFVEAIAEYEKAISLASDFPEAENNLGFVLYKKGRFFDAIVHYENAIRTKPDYATAFNNLGVVYYAIGDYDKAVLSYGKAIELRPDYVKAHLNMASCYVKQGKYEEALVKYHEAKKIDKAYVSERVNQEEIKSKLNEAGVRQLREK